MLGSVEAGDRTVVADFEAGIGTLTRMQPGDVDAVLVIVEPTPKSIEVGRRAAELAREKQLGRIVVVANRVRNDDDLEMIESSFAEVDVVRIPEDPVVVQADREGVGPLDLDRDAPAVRALADLARDLVPT